MRTVPWILVLSVASVPCFATGDPPQVLAELTYTDNDVRAGSLSAATDEDGPALRLSTTMDAPTAGHRPVSATVETVYSRAARNLGGSVDQWRLSGDLRADWGFAEHWHAMLAERLDNDWQNASPGHQEIATMKEAYVGWQPQNDVVIDLGRINPRQGVAYGYNPTDFFRADAVRLLLSPDPNSLRDNRLGTGMIRSQAFWQTGALTVLYAPKLTTHASTESLSPDWGATNNAGRWLVALSQTVVGAWQPQLLVFGQQDQSPQLGLNTTASLGESTVAYTEVSAGRQTSLLDQLIDPAAPETWRARASTGLTYSFVSKLSVTLEYEYNGTGATRNGWTTLRLGDPAIYGLYRQYVLARLDPATDSNAFIYATWTDFVLRHLDLTAFCRFDLLDHSALPYLELRHHWDNMDLALRWQDPLGNGTSDFGASPTRQTWQFVLDGYL